MHTNCPTGYQSWWIYKQGIASGISTYKRIKRPPSEAIVKPVTAILNRLTDESFSERSKNVSNQNFNELFDNVL